MQMPKPGVEHEKLRTFVGSWTGKETMQPSPWDPKGGEATGKLEARLGLDGFFLLTEYTQERDGNVTYRGHGVYGWDAKQGTYTMYWFDAMGMDPGGPARGKWEGDTLMFEMSHAMGHSRYIYTLRGDGRYDFEIHNSKDGKDWQVWLESSWTRS
jgi:hypothetical protein